MTPERWRQVEEIFQVAIDMGLADRAPYISRACGADTDLRRDVETLLAQHDSAGDLLEKPLYVAETDLSELESLPLFEDEADPMIGRRLGTYQIEREIGRGGMGAVYEAVRADNEFRRRVAIKLVKRGMDTDFILRRFRKERQILAALDHPHIAGLLDGGTTDDGLPYFVMEFIQGQQIYNYCDSRQLSVAERLKLFRAICEAVHYAHQKQVVHRDIKPSNVLVTGEGVPKLLDFGIAKLLNPDLAGDITHDPTATAMRLMTPEYASPEQVQGEPTTPTTDVYSLGVLLYELLTGHRPYRLRNRAPHEIARVICEEPPAPLGFIITRPEDVLPSSSFGDESTTLSQLYLARSATLDSLRREFVGDLDSIVMRALRKEPEWRYQTAQELRDDITRYLEGRPLSESPAPPLQAQASLEPSSQENSLAVLPLKMLDLFHGSDSGPDYLGTGLADALITRLSAIGRFAVRPTSSVLRYGADSDPLLAGRELAVAFVLDGRMRRASDRIRVTVQLLNVHDGTAVWAGQFDEQFTDVLSLEDAISSHVAEALVPHLTGEERLRLAKRGTDDPHAHEAYLRGRFYWNTFTEDGFARAIVCYNQAIALDPNYAVAYAGIAAYYSWLGSFTVLPFAECSAAAYEAASTAVALDPSMAEGHAALGQATLCRDFAWASGEREILRAIELNPNYSTARIWYALQLAMEGRFTESLREAYIARDLDPLAIISRFTVVWCLYHARRFEEAAAIALDTLASEPQNLMMLYVSSFALSRLGRHEEAIAAAQRCVEFMGKASQTLARLASAHAEAGNFAAAEAVLEELHELSQRRHVSPYHLALVNSALGRYETALDLLEQARHANDAKVLWIGVDPELDPLHGHPRFNDLLRKLNHRLAALPTLPAHSLAGQESIAVLPFKVLGSPGEHTGDEYLGVGLADALITRLSNVQRLIVRPTSSVLNYRGAAVDPLVAGRDLGVDYIIDGSLRRSGARLRVTAQMVSVSEGVTRWSEQFDEDSTDVLQIEDSISEQVANALLPQLTGDEQRQLSKRGTHSAEAFETYLRGRYYWNTYTESGFARALECYNRAIELDPDYALAYTGIADYYNWLGVFGIRPFAECAAAAKKAASKAVELDPTSAEAYTALGFATVCHFDWAVAEAHQRRAIEINPNYATAHHWHGFHLLMVGRFDEALNEMLRARELDPLSPSIMQALGWCYYHSRRFDESITTYQNMLEAVPDFTYGLATYSWTLRAIGRGAEAVAVSERVLDLSSGGQFYIAGLGAAYAAAGRTADARAALDRLQEMSATSYVSSYHRALIHVLLGEKERALEFLREAYEIGEGWLVWLGVEPQLDPLRGEPEFEELLSKTRNPAVDNSPARRRLRASAHARSASRTGSSVTSPVARPTPDTQSGENEEARQLYTAGRYYATRRTAEGLRHAIERLERAVKLDPKFALAYSELADCYALLNWYVEPPPAEAWQHAKESAINAVAADPKLAEAHASLGFVRLHHDRDWASAESELRKAIQLKPGNQVAHRWYAYSLSAMGRHQEAAAEVERAREISPQSSVIATALANVLFLAGRFDDAIEQCHQALELDPGAVSAHTILRWAYEKKGMFAEALAAYEQERSFAGDTPTTRAKRAHVLAAIGQHEEARTILDEILARRQEHWVTAYEIAIIYCLLGDRDNAFDWLARADREHAVGFTFVRVDPHLEPLRTDPRFQQLVSGSEKTIP
ncbi:MAG: eukaryotic-like serine/threonine-protein kinase [Blastocatellia bacterium]|jgi:serine/threonine protein kinase/tetratricopeptide (TPR) repeat protein|nr:eukaryotic-like serine/threonine-protein kinase [Blastocatellia bacterium]